MSSLSEQYMIEVRKVDSMICERLKATVQMNSIELNGTNDKKVAELLKRIEDKRDYIFSLFEQGFSQYEKSFREQMPKRKKTKIDRCSQQANTILKERIDEVIEEFINSEDSSVIAKSVGIARKSIIDDILDTNIEIELSGSKKHTSEYEHDDR